MALSKNPENRRRQLANLRPWKKGEKPPTDTPGRPYVAKDFRVLCRAFMEEASPEKPGGWTILAEMARDKHSPHRARAIELISAYAYGKPPSELKVTGDAEHPLALSVFTLEQLRQMLSGMAQGAAK